MKDFKEYNIPQAMIEADRWHLWKLTDDGRKIPMQINGQNAKSNDPSTWCTFTEALEHYIIAPENVYMAFELGDGFWGVDFDDAFTDDGFARDWTNKVKGMIQGNAYLEYSPSGTGMKAVLIGERPEGLSRKKYVMDQRVVPRGSG